MSRGVTKRTSKFSEQDWGDDWVHELIAKTRPGVEIEFPRRALSDRIVPFEYDDFSRIERLEGHSQIRSPLTPTLSPPRRGGWAGADDEDRRCVHAMGHATSSPLK